MNSANIGWLYYKQYYHALSTDAKSNNYADKSQVICGLTLGDRLTDPLIKTDSFLLKTTYPGLLIGSGYQHETGGDGEFKIGFFFDYTTGLPQIPGSSVKGTLRSMFPSHKKNHCEHFREPRLTYIKELIKDVASIEVDDKAVEALEKEIFEGIIVEKEETRRLSVYQRDCFYDAIISRENNNNPDGNLKFLGSDFITPHKDPLKDPIPLMFLKVLPSILFEFQFRVNNSQVIDGLMASHKLEIFRQILLDIGTGAKTNVGYGQFEIVGQKQEVSPTPPKEPIFRMEIEDQVEASVIKIDKNKCYFEFEGSDGKIYSADKKKDKIEHEAEIKIGDKLKITMLAPYLGAGQFTCKAIHLKD